MNNKLILTRDVTKKEWLWLDRTFKAGEIVYEYTDYTYGCIASSGIACTEDSSGGTPFFELPKNSINLSL